MNYDISIYDNVNEQAYGIESADTKEQAVEIATKLWFTGKYYGIMVISNDERDTDPIKWIMDMKQTKPFIATEFQPITETQGK
jgi:hypothetical protein